MNWNKIFRSRFLALAATSVASSLICSPVAQAVDQISKKFSFQGFVSDLPDGTYNMQLIFSGGNTAPTFSVSSVLVKNGVFSVELDQSSQPSLTSQVFYSSSGSGAIQVNLKIETAAGVFEDFGQIPLSSVGSAWVSEHSNTSNVAAKSTSTAALNGVTLNFVGPLSGGDDGKVVSYNSSIGQFVLATDNAGGGSPTAGTGILVSGSQVSVDVGTSAAKIPQLDGGGKILDSVLSANVPLLSGGKIPNSLIDTGATAGKIVQLDGGGKIATGLLASGSVTATEIGSSVINASHISNGVVTDAKIASGLSASKVTGSTASRFAMFDGSLQLTNSSSAVSDSEFSQLVGVTAPIQTQLNSPLSRMPAGYVYTSISPSPESGYLAMNGATASASTYATLAAAMGEGARWMESGQEGVSTYLGGATSGISIVTTTNNVLKISYSQVDWGTIANPIANGTLTSVTGAPYVSVLGSATDGTNVLVVGYQQYNFSQDEGLTWTSANTLGGVTGGSFSAAAWSGQKFLAKYSDGGGDRVFNATIAGVTSNTWVERTSAYYPGSTINALFKSGSSKVVALGTSGISQSGDDGDTWTHVVGSGSYLRGAFAGGVACALSDNPGTPGLYSTDGGISWSAAPQAPVLHYNGLLYAVNGKFIAVDEMSSNNVNTYISADCQNWTPGTGLMGGSLSAMAFVPTGTDLYYFVNYVRYKLSRSATTFMLPDMSRVDGLFRHVKY